MDSEGMSRVRERVGINGRHDCGFARAFTQLDFWKMVVKKMIAFI